MAENVEKAMTPKAKENYDIANNGLENSFKGQSEIYPNYIWDLAAKMPGESAQNLYLIAEGIYWKERANPRFQSTDIVATYMDCAVHYGNQVKKGERGIPYLIMSKSEDGLTENVKAGSVFVLCSQTDGHPLPRLKPVESSLDFDRRNHVDSYGMTFDNVMDNIENALSRHADNPIVKQMAEYIYDKHFGFVADEDGPYLSEKDTNTLIETVDDHFKDKSQEEILNSFNQALGDAYEAISIMTEYAEREMENAKEFREAEVFGVPVLFTENEDFLDFGDFMAAPVDMYFYCLFERDGQNFIAREYPNDGNVKGCIVTLNAISDPISLSYEKGLSVGNTFHITSEDKVCAKDFRTKYADTPVQDVAFHHNSKIVPVNEEIVTEKPDENLRVYGVYNGKGELIDGGFLEKNKVPHTNEEILNFTKTHDVPMLASYVIFNCEGQAYGLSLDLEITTGAFSRRETRSEDIMPEEYVQDFMAMHGADLNIPARDRHENIEAKATMSDAEPGNASVWKAVSYYKGKQSSAIPKTDKPQELSQNGSPGRQLI